METTPVIGLLEDIDKKLNMIIDHFSIGKKPARRSVIELNEIADRSLLEFRLKKQKSVAKQG